jgi:hypothetical protein
MKILLTILLLISALYSAPAFNKLREFKNADGTTFLARGGGDEYLHWIESEDGEILKYNTTSQNFEYAKVVGDALKASGEKYSQSSESVNFKSIRRTPRVTKKELQDIISRKKTTLYRAKTKY